MKKPLINRYVSFLGIAFLLTTASAFATGREGNGGDAIVCYDRPVHRPGAKMVSAELKDFWEHSQLSIHKLDLREGRTFLEKVEKVFDRISRFDPKRPERLRTYLENFHLVFAMIDRAALKELDDSPSSLIPKGNCVERQVAYQMVDRVEKSILIDKEIFNLMNEKHKAGLILHELFYREDIKYGGATNSNAVRKYTFLMSSDFLKNTFPEQYMWTVKELGLTYGMSVFPIGGTWMSANSKDPRRFALEEDAEIELATNPFGLERASFKKGTLLRMLVEVDAVKFLPESWNDLDPDARYPWEFARNFKGHLEGVSKVNFLTFDSNNEMKKWELVGSPKSEDERELDTVEFKSEDGSIAIAGQRIIFTLDSKSGKISYQCFGKCSGKVLDLKFGQYSGPFAYTDWRALGTSAGEAKFEYSFSTGPIMLETDCISEIEPGLVLDGIRKYRFRDYHLDEVKPLLSFDILFSKSKNLGLKDFNFNEVGTFKVSYENGHFASLCQTRGQKSYCSVSYDGKLFTFPVGGTIFIQNYNIAVKRVKIDPNTQAVVEAWVRFEKGTTYKLRGANGKKLKVKGRGQILKLTLDAHKKVIDIQPL
jgi:hypothetical protein